MGALTPTPRDEIRGCDLVSTDDLLSEFDDLDSYFCQFRPKSQPTRVNAAIPSHTPESTALSKDLKKRGWSFVGPTTSYAFMQAMGLVNDHVQGCHRA